MDVLEKEETQRRIANIRKHVSIWQVLSHYGIDYSGEHEQQISCPFPENHQHGDTKKSCRVYEDGWILCYACMDRQKDVVGIVRAKENLDFFPTLYKIESQYGVPTAHLEKSVNLKKKLDSILNPDDPTDSRLFEEILSKGEKILITNRDKLSMEQFVSLLGMKDDLLYDAHKGMPYVKVNEISAKWLKKVKSICKGQPNV